MICERCGRTFFNSPVGRRVVRCSRCPLPAFRYHDECDERSDTEPEAETSATLGTCFPDEFNSEGDGGE